jgi:hypothetical protein
LYWFPTVTKKVVGVFVHVFRAPAQPRGNPQGELVGIVAVNHSFRPLLVRLEIFLALMSRTDRPRR